MRYTTSLIIRVTLALALFIVPTGIFHINIFQAVFESITLKTVYIILKMVDTGAVIGSYSIRHAIDIFGGYTINIVKYCVTASAYYLYTLLVIMVYDVSVIKRIEMIIIGYLAIFAMNIVRILVLVLMLVEKGPEYFANAHDFLGTALSIFYVVAIWFLFSVALSAKNIPIITDIKILVQEIMKKNEV